MRRQRARGQGLRCQAKTSGPARGAEGSLGWPSGSRVVARSDLSIRNILPAAGGGGMGWSGMGRGELEADRISQGRNFKTLTKAGW